ncbi:hypothetical protein M0811_09590 [Anaeramoeba ignava]|uniref:Uncharacterized protein n=1 Tax=Anaeramoeba ignava TaxID=1746090 RepID=A0A9Q0LI06_ANAIG|nr:hypothetical protein M0811_09590 [Anaeramoeba ignava]
MGNDLVSKKISKKGNKKYFKSIQESKEAVLIIDHLTLINQVNPSFIKLSGYPNDTQIIGKRISEISAAQQPHLGLRSDLAVLSVLKKILNSVSGTYQTPWFFKFPHQEKTEIIYTVWITLFSLNNKQFAQLILRKNETTTEKTAKKEDHQPSPVISLLDTHSGTTTDSTEDEDTQEADKRFEEQNQEEPEEVLNQHIELIQQKLELVKDPANQEKIRNHLKEVFDSMFDAFHYKNEQISKIKDRLDRERAEHQKKYEKLEQHLQRRLGGIKTEKNVKKTVLDENQIIKNKLTRLLLVLDRQSEVTKELYRLIEERDEKEKEDSNEDIRNIEIEMNENSNENLNENTNENTNENLNENSNENENENNEK